MFFIHPGWHILYYSLPFWQFLCSVLSPFRMWTSCSTLQLLQAIYTYAGYSRHYIKSQFDMFFACRKLEVSPTALFHAVSISCALFLCRCFSWFAFGGHTRSDVRGTGYFPNWNVSFLQADMLTFHLKIDHGPFPHLSQLPIKLMCSWSSKHKYGNTHFECRAVLQLLLLKLLVILFSLEGEEWHNIFRFVSLQTFAYLPTIFFICDSVNKSRCYAVG